MDKPVPLGLRTLNNSPLEPDGSDFPCKQRTGVYELEEMNIMEAGNTYQVHFVGGATHGGGSAQIAITTDLAPTPQSVWKVIHSIHGGFPNNADGNLSGNPDDPSNPSFPFTIPKNLPNGEYVLATSWFNKIGNREMYMNCAAVTVTGGSNDSSALDDLPDMFVANIGNGCETAENQDFVFPNPGKSVVETPGSDFGQRMSGSGCQSASSSPRPVTQSPTQQDTSQNVEQEVEQDADLGGIFVETPVDSRPNSLDNVSIEAPVSNQPKPPVSLSEQPDAAGTIASSSNMNCESIGRIPCDKPDGSIICLENNQFGRCDINGCLIPQLVNDGMVCRDNGLELQKRTVQPSSRARRHRRHARAIPHLSH